MGVNDGDYGGDGDRGGKSFDKSFNKHCWAKEPQPHWLHICQFSDGDEDYNHEEGCRVISNWT